MRAWIHQPQNRGGSWSKKLTQQPPSPPHQPAAPEVQNSWVFEKLEFLQHTMNFKKVEGVFSCPGRAL